MADGQPRSTDVNGWTAWRLERMEAAAEKAAEALERLPVIVTQMEALNRRMDQRDTRDQNVSRALWGLAATIIAALIIFVVTGHA